MPKYLWKHHKCSLSLSTKSILEPCKHGWSARGRGSARIRARTRRKKKKTHFEKKMEDLRGKKRSARGRTKIFFHPEKKEDLRGDFFQMLKKRKIYAEIFSKFIISHFLVGSEIWDLF